MDGGDRTLDTHEMWENAFTAFSEGFAEIAARSLVQTLFGASEDHRGGTYAEMSRVHPLTRVSHGLDETSLIHRDVGTHNVLATLLLAESFRYGFGDSEGFGRSREVEERVAEDPLFPEARLLCESPDFTLGELAAVLADMDMATDEGLEEYLDALQEHYPSRFDDATHEHIISLNLQGEGVLCERRGAWLESPDEGSCLPEADALCGARVSVKGTGFPPGWSRVK